MIWDHSKLEALNQSYCSFAEGNQQHRVNGLRWDMEGWLYVANGDSGGAISVVNLSQRL